VNYGRPIATNPVKPEFYISAEQQVVDAVVPRAGGHGQSEGCGASAGRQVVGS
jgi:hypothetical protein